MKNIYHAKDFDTAEIVYNYPYGFKKTQKRYWIETKAKRGDRLVTVTLNPTTQKWNAPKYSTYSPIMILTRKETEQHPSGYVSAYTIDGYHADQLEGKLALVWDHLNADQINQAKKMRAINKVMENVTFTCKAVEYRHKVTGEVTTSIDIFRMGEYERVDGDEHDEKQARTLNQINRAIDYELSQQ